MHHGNYPRPLCRKIMFEDLLQTHTELAAGVMEDKVTIRQLAAGAIEGKVTKAAGSWSNRG